MWRTLAIAALAAALLSPGLARAQHDEHAEPRVGPEKLGTVSFANSCAPTVNADFNRAVALLHSFEFRHAIDGFEGVLAHDSSCAIAYWGIALSYWGNPFAGSRSDAALAEGLASVAKGRSTGTPTPRERGFIDAAAALYENYQTVSQRDRILAYERGMAEIARSNPNDIESRIFYALAVNQTALPSDKTYAAQLKAAGILEPLFKQHPDHPGLAHYIIHAYDHPPLAAHALDAARAYASIAPDSPHALHMPSHTFTRVGSWEESVATNTRSEQAAVQQNVPTEALHAMDYETYAYLQMAQDRAARDVLDRLPKVAATFDANAPASGAAPPMAAFYALAAIPARYALERGAWTEAEQLAVPTSGTPFTIAIVHFARSLGAARAGHASVARADVDRLAALRDQLKGRDDYWAEQVDIQWRAAGAWVAFAEGHRSDAITAMRGAADIEDASDKAAVTPGPLAPARELLGEMLLDADQASDALQEFEASIAREPNRFRGAYGAARAAEVTGNAAAARRYYDRALEIARTSDSARPEIARARTYLAGNTGR